MDKHEPESEFETSGSLKTLLPRAFPLDPVTKKKKVPAVIFPPLAPTCVSKRPTRTRHGGSGRRALFRRPLPTAEACGLASRPSKSSLLGPGCPDLELPNRAPGEPLAGRARLLARHVPLCHLQSVEGHARLSQQPTAIKRRFWERDGGAVSTPLTRLPVACPRGPSRGPPFPARNLFLLEQA